jgi:type IV pilus assembly protein PilY1
VSVANSGDPALQQRFANWYSYYRTRLLAVKTAVTRAFAPLDQRVRVGFMAINSTFADDRTANFLRIQDFTDQHKYNWMETFTKTPAVGPTPLLRALSAAGQYFAGKMTMPLNGLPGGLNEGGAHQPIISACQSNFAIASSDGGWNTVMGHKLDGSAMDDADRDGVVGTLADVAQHYYDIDLRPDLDDRVPRREIGSMIDDNKRQHMSTFTLGFGVSGHLSFDPGYLDYPAGDYPDLLAGRKAWWNGAVINQSAYSPADTGDQRAKIDDLWHAAVNGRGQAYFTGTADEFEGALLDALLNVTNTRASGGGAGTSAIELSGTGEIGFRTSYFTKGWTGDVAGYDLGGDGVMAFAPSWNAGSLLDQKPWKERRIFFARENSSDMIPFQFGSFMEAEIRDWFMNSKAFTSAYNYKLMTAAQRKVVDSGELLVDFLRGDRTYEGFVRGRTDRLFRKRMSVLGDIVNSQPVYVKAPFFAYADKGYTEFADRNRNRQAIALVGANDGMLHAFYAAGPKAGQEAWAYVPREMLRKIARLADSSYDRNHDYFVDGTVAVGDVKIRTDLQGGGVWRTIAVGGFNNGGRGYYAIDITDTENPKPLWEFQPGQCRTELEANGNPKCHLGQSYGTPIIVKLPPAAGEPEGRWVVMVTSGYNNMGDSLGDGNGRVFVLDAVTGNVIQTASTETRPGYPAGNKTLPSNLGPLAGWVDDARTDNTVKRVYAGDMLGYVWRFDVTDAGLSRSQLIAELSGLGPTTTVDSRGETVPITPKIQAQPVTTRPELALVDGYPTVFVATGRMLGYTDLPDDSVQSIYAIRDPGGPYSLNAVVPKPREQLQRIELVTSKDNTTRTTKGSTCTAPCDATLGWYADMPPGERMTTNMRLQLGALVFPSNIPTPNDCVIGGTSWLNYVDMRTGLPLTAADSAGGGSTALRIGDALIAGMGLVKATDGKLVSIVTTVDSVVRSVDIPVTGSGGTMRRINWREVVQ